ncbi:hypothetical protein YC2023_071434 [Brassica napus]
MKIDLLLDRYQNANFTKPSSKDLRIPIELNHPSIKKLYPETEDRNEKHSDLDEATRQNRPRELRIALAKEILRLDQTREATNDCRKRKLSQQFLYDAAASLEIEMRSMMEYMVEDDEQHASGELSRIEEVDISDMSLEPIDTPTSTSIDIPTVTLIDHSL